MIPSFKWDVHVNIIVCTGPGLSCQVTALWKRLFWKEPAQMALSLWSSGPQRGTNYLWVLEGGGRMKGHSVAFREKEWKVFCFNEVLSAWPSAQGLHFFCLFLYTWDCPCFTNEESLSYSDQITCPRLQLNCQSWDMVARGWKQKEQKAGWNNSLPKALEKCIRGFKMEAKRIPAESQEKEPFKADWENAAQIWGGVGQ